MWPLKDSYGLAKRAEFLYEEIERRSPRNVLDYGCGTGANLTIPLGERFPLIQFLGVDSDAASIAYARASNSLPNLRFRLLPQELGRQLRFDLIIASEVLEHADDPADFLDKLCELLADEGAIVLTVPNGYGPFEMASLAQTVLQLTGILPVLRWVKRALAPAQASLEQVDTLAASPHVNFFSFDELVKFLSGRGLRLVRYRARTFLCGFGFDQLLCSQRLLACNARLADHLPARLVSGWMFVLEPGALRMASRYHRSAYARFRRRLNLRKLRLAAATKPT